MVGKIGDVVELIKGKVVGLIIVKGFGDLNVEFIICLCGVILLQGGFILLVLVDGIEGGLGMVFFENIVFIDVLKDVFVVVIYGI